MTFFSLPYSDGQMFPAEVQICIYLFLFIQLAFSLSPQLSKFSCSSLSIFFTQNVKFSSRWFHLYVWDVWGVFFFFLATLSQNSRTGPLTFEGINWKVCNSRYITESCSLRSWKKSGPPTGWACAFEILKEKVVEHSNRKRKGMFCDNYVVLNIMFQGL